MHMRTVFRALCVAVTVGLLVDSGFAWVGPPVAPPSARGPGIGWGHDRHRRCDPSDPNACPDFAFCRLHDGICDSADVMGVCTPVPQACPDVWLPVCGCDGVTYGNRCEAYAARMSIAHAGECEPPAVCDGFAGIPCDDGEFCLHPRGTCDWADVQGVCVDIPNACPAIWMPVCGCDGVTYSNACEAIRAGVQVDHAGECVQLCDGFLGLPCDDGEFCQHPFGTCNGADVQGECVPVPNACPDVWIPVCGCDGVTYSNLCEARMAQVQVDHPGECEPPFCDGFAGIPCDNGEFCLHPYGTCDWADVQGMCVPIPQGCPDVWIPVCGCDGNTYSNECDAIAAQVQIAHPGECAQVCGGFLGIPCHPGEFCKLPIGQCCCDHQGVCVTIPNACPENYDPVCGCDGVTYTNECHADAASVSIDHHGPCHQLCDGFAGIPCDPGEFCQHPFGTCNGADVQGECVPVPNACPDVWMPVCGCDGVTYGNLCEAQMAQVQVDHPGECP